MCVSLSLLTIILVVLLYIPIFIISYKIVIINTKYKIKENSNNMKPLFQFNWNKIFNPSNNSPSKGKYNLG
jgi:hypothetical protein